jgi:very-short-patch-repair endonuclease
VAWLGAATSSGAASPVFRSPEWCTSACSACSSGVESAARLGFLDARLPFEVQVVVAEGLRVDFVIDGVVVVEVDGSEFHSGREAFVADRKRDAFLNALGYRVLHFTYAMILFDWPSVLSTVTMVLRRERAHRAGSAPLPPFRR